MKRIFFIFLLLLLGCLSSLKAQQRPQPQNEDAEEDRQLINLKLPDPQKAALFSAVLPGLGQAYNRSYWKIPVLYGAAFGLGYAIKYNNTLYQDFREDLIREHSGLGAVNFPVLEGRKDRLQYYTDYYRRNRDLLYILGGVLYLMNIVEANVDAHLQEFRMYRSLEKVDIKPTLINSGPMRGPSTLGVSVKMKL